MPAFKLVSDMPAAGDQPAAIDALAGALEAASRASPCWA
jgi:excinuclease UvrABC helicase subunit UvrB